MKRCTGSMLLFFLAVGGLGIAAAQESAAVPPPKILQISREFTKPGKAGTAHTKTESLFVQAMRNAKWPTHYLAVESVTGKSRALFLTRYESFADWEKDIQGQQKNAALSAALDNAWAKDGDLLSDMDSGLFQFNEEYSLRPNVDIAHSRYFEIGRFTVRPGHEKDWDEIMKMEKAAYEKIPDAHWAMYTEIYGSTNSTYVYFIPMKSATEMDAELGWSEKIEAAMGEAAMKRFGELEAAAVQETQTNLFAFNPRMSYARDEWIKADPDFWAPKAGAGRTAAPAAKKKAGAPAAP